MGDSSAALPTCKHLVFVFADGSGIPAQRHPYSEKCLPIGNGMYVVSNCAQKKITVYEDSECCGASAEINSNDWYNQQRITATIQGDCGSDDCPYLLQKNHGMSGGQIEPCSDIDEAASEWIARLIGDCEVVDDGSSTYKKITQCVSGVYTEKRYPNASCEDGTEEATLTSDTQNPPECVQCEPEPKSVPANCPDLNALPCRHVAVDNGGRITTLPYAEHCIPAGSMYPGEHIISSCANGRTVKVYQTPDCCDEPVDWNTFYPHSPVSIVNCGQQACDFMMLKRHKEEWDGGQMQIIKQCTAVLEWEAMFLNVCRREYHEFGQPFEMAQCVDGKVTTGYFHDKDCTKLLGSHALDLPTPCLDCEPKASAPTTCSPETAAPTRTPATCKHVVMVFEDGTIQTFPYYEQCTPWMNGYAKTSCANGGTMQIYQTPDCCDTPMDVDMFFTSLLEMPGVSTVKNCGAAPCPYMLTNRKQDADCLGKSGWDGDILDMCLPLGRRNSVWITCVNGVYTKKWYEGTRCDGADPYVQISDQMVPAIPTECVKCIPESASGPPPTCSPQTGSPISTEPMSTRTTCRHMAVTIGGKKFKFPYTEKCMALPEMEAQGESERRLAGSDENDASGMYLKMSCPEQGAGSITMYRKSDCKDRGMDFNALMRYSGAGASASVENCDQPACDYLLRKQHHAAQNCTDHDDWKPMLIDECIPEEDKHIKITSCVEGKAMIDVFASSSTCEGEATTTIDSSVGSTNLKYPALPLSCVACGGARIFTRYGTLTIATGYDKFQKAAEDMKISEKELAEKIIKGTIKVDGVEITINGVTSGSTVIDYSLEVSSTADVQLLQTAVTNLDAAAKKSDAIVISMGNGENVSFPILTNEITDAPPGAGSPASDDLILGLSTVVFVAIIVGACLLLAAIAVGLWWKCYKSSEPQQGNEAGGRPNGQGGEVKVYVAKD